MVTTHGSPDSPGVGIKQGLLTRNIQKILGLVLIPFFLVIIAILAALNLTTVYEPPFLLSVLNTLFIGIIPIIIAYIAFGVFTKNSSVGAFLIGSGVLIFGLGSIAAGWLNSLPGGPNMTVTIHNTSAFISSVLVLTGAVATLSDTILWRNSKRAWIVAVTYTGILVFVTLFSLATLQEMVPPFFIPGTGPTVIRQVILENATAFFALSSLLFMVIYIRKRSEFFFLYSVSLALISIGLLAVFFQPSVGSFIGWVGRSAQYLGFVFVLYAVLTARRAATAKGLPIDEVIANFFVDAEQSYKMLVETANDAIVTFDEDDRVLLWNAAAERMFGYTRDEAIGSSFPELAIDDRYTAIIKNEDEDIPVGGQHTRVPKSVEISGKRKDGTLFPVDLTISRRRQEGRLIRTCILRDITERKKIEVALNATETRYRRLFEAAQDGILILDAETGQIVDANPFLINLLGFSHEQFLGKKIWEIGIFKDIVANKDNFEELQRKEYIRYEDLPLETADGRRIDVEFVSNVYVVNQTRVIQCSIRDITERKKMTEQIEASLAEKETLLKEIHHRVKNNLQIITSILNLQIRKIDDPLTIEALKDSQSRVRSMALVHEHLYRGKDFSHIDLGNYIRALGTALFQSYEAAKQGIRFDLNIRDIYVDINTSVPLGLISNELITNSLKYAFKEKKDGKISITATEDPQALTFVVADNGVGMPEGIMLENQTSLGLRLVSLLTSQIKGTVTIDRTEGTKFVFTIPKPAEQKPTEDARK